MTIKIKNHEYDVVEWIDENRELKIRFSTDETLAMLADVFEGENEITILTEESEIAGYWYSNHVIAITNQNHGIYEVKLSGSPLDTNAEGRLSDSIGDTEGAIFELADMISTLESAHNDSERFVNQYKERVEEVIRSADTKSNHTDERFNEQTGNLNRIQEQISELRQEITNIRQLIDQVPTNISDRTIVLENTYNQLADRVAGLENRR